MTHWVAAQLKNKHEQTDQSQEPSQTWKLGCLFFFGFQPITKHYFFTVFDRELYSTVFNQSKSDKPEWIRSGFFTDPLDRNCCYLPGICHYSRLTAPRGPDDAPERAARRGASLCVAGGALQVSQLGTPRDRMGTEWELWDSAVSVPDSSRACQHLTSEQPS